VAMRGGAADANQPELAGRGSGFIAPGRRNDQSAGPGILEVKLEFVEPVGRIERRGGADCRSSQERDDHLQTVRQGHSDAISAAKTKVVEPGGQGIYLPPKLIVSDHWSVACNGDGDV